MLSADQSIICHSCESRGHKSDPREGQPSGAAGWSWHRLPACHGLQIGQEKYVRQVYGYIFESISLTRTYWQITPALFGGEKATSMAFWMFNRAAILQVSGLLDLVGNVGVTEDL